MRDGSTSLKAIGLAIAIAFLVVAPARAATYSVTTTADPVGGAGPCIPALCTLRAAVVAATNPLPAAEPDLIQVPAGTYTLAQGALVIPAGQTQITLVGAGAGQTVISANNASRVFSIGGQIAIRGVTLRDGRAADGGEGANVEVTSGGNLSLDHVRVTAGFASTGAGIAGLGAQSIQISNSLIDNNFALANPPTYGGGMFIDGQTSNNTALQVRDSTFASNAAAIAGGAIAVQNNANAQMLLRGVTIARNLAGTSGGGLALVTAVGAPLPKMTISGSIFAANTGANSLPSNCTGTPPLDGGGNVETAVDCGLKASGRQNTDPQLSATLVDAGGQTQLFALAPTSPAIDIATCNSTSDQRDLARPQGAACDAGAYELAQAQPPPPPPPPNPPIILPPPRQLVPVARQHVIGVTASGKVLVRLPGTRRFVPLAQVRELPLGTVVNATAGRIRIASAADGKGNTQTAVFYGGIFKIGETGPAKRLTTVLALFGNEPRCPKPKPKAKRAESSARKKSRRLWGDGKGRFQTKGQYSSATVRGTKWLVQDGCKGTLTKVARGSVTVRDFAKRKNVVVKAGRRYLARP